MEVKVKFNNLIFKKNFFIQFFKLILVNKKYFSLIILCIFIFNYKFINFKFKSKIFKFHLKNRILYLNHKNKTYNSNNLKTLYDKINWLIIYDSNMLKSKCADKILLHKYSKKKLGKDICNKIIKIYNSEDQINFNELPEKFVLKANHGSGFNLIVRNKSKLNISKVKNILRKWIKIDYGLKKFEFHYSAIKKKLFCEKLIEKYKIIKFLCYQGKPKYVHVTIKKKRKKYKNFYDMNWKFLNLSCVYKSLPNYKYPKPKFFDLMKKYAKILSSDFKFVSVDFYEMKDKIILSELTFTPTNSYFFCNNKLQEIELGKDIIIDNEYYFK